VIAPLRERDFRLAWFGGLAAMLGDWALFIALPIHVYRLTGSTLATGGMFVAQLVPALLLGSVAGVFVDRWDRKRTLVVANLLLALCLLPLLAVRSADWVWVTYAVGAGQAVVAQFVRPAEGALLPRLVEEDHLLAANALNTLNDNLARLLGPALGGSAMGLFGLAAVVWLVVACLLIAAGLLAAIAASGRAGASPRPGPAATGNPMATLGREWREGVALVRRDRVVAILLLLQGIASFGEGVFSVMFVVWVNDVLAGGARELGWLMSAQAVGGLLGGALLGPVLARLGPVRLLGFGAVLFGLLDVALFNYPRLVPGLWPGLLLIALVGLPAITIGAGFATLVQRAVEDEFRGRVFGVIGTSSALLRLAGTLVAGLLGGLVGPLLLLNLQGGSYVVMGLLALRCLPGTAAIIERAPAVGPNQTGQVAASLPSGGSRGAGPP